MQNAVVFGKIDSMVKKSQMSEADKDNQSGFNLSARYHQIGKNPGAEYRKPTLAAGAVLWRHGDNGTAEVAVIHRPRYDDWSLAKGKVDPGESLASCCVREIAEETGYQVQLGSLLGSVNYPVQGRTKVVFYWNAEVTGGKFRKNDEVNKLRWLSVNEAHDKLTYDTDRRVLEQAAIRHDDAVDTRVLYVRHAKAHDRKTWSGDDNLRPLHKKGRRQAEFLVPMLNAYKPTALYSAEPARCQSTVAPLSDALSLPVTTEQIVGDAGLDDIAAATARFREIATGGGVPVIVSQGGIMPEIIETLAAEADFDIEPREFKKAGTWVLALREGKLVGADYLASPLPVR